MTNDNDATFQELYDAQREIDRLKAENFQLKGELGSIRSGSAKVLRFKEQEIKALRSDNVRLAAALQQAVDVTTALRDLLGPTLRLLEGLQEAGALNLSYDIDHVEEQLARLRAAMGEKP